jgi:hypothetical protein
MCLHLVGFSTGLSSYPFILMSELLPERIRNHASGLCFFVNGAASFAVVELFYKMADNPGLPATFGIYGSVCFINVAVILLIAPNTVGKSLIELQNKYSNYNLNKLDTPDKA